MYLHVDRLHHTPTPPKPPGRVETTVATPAAPVTAGPAPAEPMLAESAEPALARLRRDQGSRPACLKPLEVVIESPVFCLFWYIFA
jgi:hypothetical protein